ncbi:helix-turn-helix transcriptional regulator [Roseovarius salinarum]|uniref:helix-turn-helix transcriptional regulator n=1 Tax=Roseovarius salinarum TaxID=1981892 RepID=UPI0012FFDE5A|nr:helix-turn-helix transcriptional regulator [Roseovarius salinarum]
MAAFSDVVTRIYAAGVDPGRWQDVVDALHRGGGGIKTQLFGHDATSGLNIGMVTCGYDPDFLTAYADHFGAINPWVPAMLSAPEGSVLSAAEMCPADAMARTEFYNDWVRPQGDIRCGGGLVLFRDDHRTVMLGANIRARDADRHEADWLALCGLLRPHLAQAFEISRQVAGRRLEAAAADAAGHGEPALILVDWRAHILYASAPAQRMLSEGGVVRFDGRNRLSFCERRADAAFNSACADLRAGAPLSPARFAVAAGNGAHRLGCRILPFQTGAGAAGALGPLCDVNAPCLLVCLGGVQGQGAGRAPLCDLYGMTPTEAEVAERITDGWSVAGLAQQRGVSRHTTRNQLKAAMAKCGARRQADLVRVVLASRDGPRA